MAYTGNEMFTPCNWEKSQTCKNKFLKCEFCNQTYYRQGLTIFADSSIQNNYVADPKLVKRFKEK